MTEQPMVDAMTFIHDAIFDRNAIPGPGTAADFFAGEAAMTITQISRASLLNAEVLGAANPLLSPEQIEAVVIKGISTGQVKPGHANFAEIQQTVRAALDALWVADADVPAVMKAVCDRLQPLLAQ